MLESRSTVFVVDDDASVCEALESLIRACGWDVESLGSARAFLDSAPRAGPNCLLLDVNLPDLSGLELQQLVARDRPEMPIIIITGYGDVPNTVRAMKAGAVEFLTKPVSDNVLLEAVEAALERSRAVLSEIAAMKLLRNRYALLSNREREVMSLVVSGLLNKQVGGELGISEITVKAHRGRVMGKMQAHSLADLVKISARLGLSAPWTC